MTNNKIPIKLLPLSTHLLLESMAIPSIGITQFSSSEIVSYYFK